MSKNLDYISKDYYYITSFEENKNFFKDLYINAEDIEKIIITYKGKKYIFDTKLLCKELEK